MSRWSGKVIKMEKAMVYFTFIPCVCWHVLARSQDYKGKEREGKGEVQHLWSSFTTKWPW